MTQKASQRPADPSGGVPTCALCATHGGRLVWQGTGWRVVRVVDEPVAASCPAYYRVVAGAHVAELSDLDPAVLQQGVSLVVAVERALRASVQPDKINVAALGNQVPHLHFHVIARHVDDPHYPDAVWAPPRRAADPALCARLRQALPATDAAVQAALDAV